MRTFWFGLRTELRHSFFWWLMPVLIGVWIYAALSEMLPGVAYWPDIFRSINVTAVFIAPILAGTAAWIASRERRRRLAYLRELAAVPSWWPAGAELAALAVGVSVLVAAVLLTSIGRAFVLGVSGLVSPAYMIVTWLGLLQYTALGYLVGKLVPSRFTPPLVAALVYVLYLLSFNQSGRPWYFVYPFLDEIVPVFNPPRPGLHATQALWLAGATAVMVSLALLVGGRSQAILSLTVAGTTVAIAGIVMLWPYNGRFHTSEVAQVRYVCATQQITICVHPSYERALPELATNFRDIAMRVGGTPASFTKLEHRPRGPQPVLPKGVRPLFLDDLRPGWIASAKREFFSSLINVDKCYAGQNPEFRALTNAVLIWLSNPAFAGSAANNIALDPQADSPSKALAHLGGLSVEAGSRWLDRHYSAFVDCRLTLADFN